MQLKVLLVLLLGLVVRSYQRCSTCNSGCTGVFTHEFSLLPQLLFPQLSGLSQLSPCNQQGLGGNPLLDWLTPPLLPQLPLVVPTCNLCNRDFFTSGANRRRQQFPRHRFLELSSGLPEYGSRSVVSPFSTAFDLDHSSPYPRHIAGLLDSLDEAERVDGSPGSVHKVSYSDGRNSFFASYSSPRPTRPARPARLARPARPARPVDKEGRGWYRDKYRHRGYGNSFPPDHHKGNLYLDDYPYRRPGRKHSPAGYQDTQMQAGGEIKKIGGGRDEFKPLMIGGGRDELKDQMVGDGREEVKDQMVEDGMMVGDGQTENAAEN